MKVCLLEKAIKTKELDHKGKTYFTYCFDIQALCSKASSDVPTFDLKKSICFLNCAIASSGALC